MASTYKPLTDDQKGEKNFFLSDPPITHVSTGQSSSQYDSPHFEQNHDVNQTSQSPSRPVTSPPQRNYVNTTGVVTSQPKHMWRTGLGDCCMDCDVCCRVFCCGTCYAAALATRMDESCWVGFCPAGPLAMRTSFRLAHHIEGSLLEDVCVSCFCGMCVLCQLGNEMNIEKYPKSACCDC